jgi:hypothetical protein
MELYLSVYKKAGGKLSCKGTALIEAKSEGNSTGDQ